MTVGNAFAWTGGTMRDAGTTTVAPAATLTRQAENTVFLESGRLLEIKGTLDFRTDRFISLSGVPAPLIHNEGTVVKSAGAGTATISPAIDNDGVIRSDSGTLTLNGGDGAGSSDGDFGGPAAAGTVRLGTGTFELGDGASLLGHVELDGATVAVLNAATATASGANELATGELGGTGTLSVPGTLSWTGGTMADAGTTRVEAAGTPRPRRKRTRRSWRTDA